MKHFSGEQRELQGGHVAALRGILACPWATCVGSQQDPLLYWDSWSILTYMVMIY